MKPNAGATYTPCPYCGDTLRLVDCVHAQLQGKRPSRAARIKQLREDEGMSIKDAEAWADYHDDYKANASAR